MKELKRRIRRLEQRLAPQPASKGPSAIDILRERRRRRLEAAGQPIEEPAPAQLASGAGRPRSVVEILRQAYERNRYRVASNRGEVTSR
jgi:hypothetical protein